MDIENRVFQQKQDLVVKSVGKEFVIVPLKNNVAEMDILYTLNETGVFIWNQIDGKNDVNQIICMLMDEFAVDEPTARGDVIDIIERMIGKVIVEKT